MKKQIHFLFLSLILAFAGACATTPLESVPTGNPGQLVSQLEADLASAKSNQVDVLAPKSYKDAQSASMKAKEALERGARISSISDHVAEGRAHLKRAEETAQVSRTVLAQTNQARDRALKAGAERLGEPYLDVEREYLRLTQAIENDNLSYAQNNAGRIQAAFVRLEILAIKNNALGNARNMMLEADRANIQRIAPVAYNDARQALNEADAYIEENPYEAETIARKAAHAEFLSRRMMKISESSEDFRKMTPEAAALYVEALLARLGKAMDTGDLRDRSFEGQINMMIGTAEAVEIKNQALEMGNQEYQAKIAALEQQVAGLQGLSREQEEVKRNLAAEREFNERFNEVQAFFRPEEAEVYKQGGQLVIRMRGIQFPVGAATLTPENYVLLSKVQRAIQAFDQPTVIIEGHTDSTGSAQTNKELSQKRAEAVKTYLVANRTLPEDLIRAAGYGPDRPLSPNTTPEGRAINRRIDVLITPSPIR
jgi:OmpA-OmpF porin, OOP family